MEPDDSRSVPIVGLPLKTDKKWGGKYNLGIAQNLLMFLELETV